MKKASVSSDKKKQKNISKIVHNGVEKWVATITIDGKKYRAFRATESKAKEALENFKAIKTTGLADLRHLTAPQLADVLAALNVLPEGKTLLECVNKTCAYSAELSTEDVATEFLEAKERRGMSRDEFSHIQTRMKDFCREFPCFDKAPSDKIVAYLKGKGSPKTVINWKGTISSFYKYAFKKGIINNNPFNYIFDDDFERIAKTPPGFLAVPEAKAFLAMLEKEYPQYVKFYVLGMFAGMRVAEIQRLEEKWINYNERRISLPAQIVKGNKAWVLETLPDNFWAWMEKYKKQPIKKPYHSLRSKWLEKYNLLHNFARHSFATYHISLYHDYGATAMITRHDKIQTLKDDYMGALVTKKQAAAYFGIFP